MSSPATYRSSQSRDSSLPHTGEAKNEFLPILGIISLTGLASISKRKKDIE